MALGEGCRQAWAAEPTNHVCEMDCELVRAVEGWGMRIERVARSFGWDHLLLLSKFQHGFELSTSDAMNSALALYGVPHLSQMRLASDGPQLQDKNVHRYGLSTLVGTCTKADNFWSL